MSASQSRVTDENQPRRIRAAIARRWRSTVAGRRSARGAVASGRILAHGDCERRGAGAARPPSRSRARRASKTSIETAALRPTLDDEVEELAPGASEADRAARRDYEFDAHHSDGASAADRGRGAPAHALEDRRLRAGACRRRDDRRRVRAERRRAGPEKGCPVHRRGAGTDQGCAPQRPDGHDVQRRWRHSAP